jgi:hypothetical protein
MQEISPSASVSLEYSSALTSYDGISKKLCISRPVAAVGDIPLGIGLSALDTWR